MRIKQEQGKEWVFCDWRKTYVRLTPEEWVRQHFLHLLVEQYAFPMSFIGVEVSIRVGDAQKRCDAVVYDRQLQPTVLIEFKAEQVALTQKTLDQAVTYNRTLGVPYLILHNRRQTIMAEIRGEEVRFLQEIPAWNTIDTNK